MIELRGGHVTQDRRLDRIPQQDERSRAYGVSELVGNAPIATKNWLVKPRLDQGQEGACVGFGWSHELAGSPVGIRNIDDAFAREVYYEAQKIDPWPGGAYPGATPNYDGTSVLAGAKVLQTRGYIKEYRWAFTVDEVLQALSNEGPVVLGLPWLDTMFAPRPSGLLDCSGKVSGGHCILARGHTTSRRMGYGEGTKHVVRLRNSWGNDWGLDGDCFLTVEDLERLLLDNGDACVPVGRQRISR